MALSRIPSHQFTIDSNITIPTGKKLNAVDTAGVYAPGCVLQVIQTYYTDKFSSSSATPADVTGFAATITPKFATSKVLVMLDVMIGGGVDSYPYLLLKRNGTVIGSGTGATGSQINTIGGGYFTALSTPVNYTMKQSSSKFLDNPSTTSSVTYQLQFASPYLTAGFINRQNATDNNTYIQFPTSNITLLEIAQ
jgi:hypothetical protein